MSTNVLALDIGTSSVRAMIIDEKGNILHKEQRRYDVILVSKYMQEQSPVEIEKHFKDIVRACIENAGIDRQSIKAMSFSSQMYNIFPVDVNGNPLYHMILWSDSRSDEQAERLSMIYGKSYLYEATGCPLNSMYPLSKIMWLRENEQEIAEKAYKYISIKEYIMEKMIGQYVIDYSMASGSGMFNIHRLDWDSRALGMVGITEEQLSCPVSGAAVFEFRNEKLREELGLPKGIKVVPGGGDGPLANLGSGASKEGVINIDLGTSGAARVLTSGPVVDSEQRMWTYAVTDQMWVYGGILSNVGNGYQWMIRNIAEFAYAKSMDEIFDVVDKKLHTLPPACDDLLFLPYLIKCRSPYWDDKVKATVYGLTHEHTFVDIVKSYLESIGFDLFSLVNIISEQVKICPDLILTGGLSRTKTMCQMLADILGKKIITLNMAEGSIMGAAVFALFGIGALKDLAFEKDLAVDTVYQPDIDKHISYQKKYVKYVRLRNAMYNIDL